MVVHPDGSFGQVPGGGGTVTVMAADALLASLVAVIVAPPTAMPLTSPPPLTVATPRVLLDQVTTRPLSGLPAESFGVATSCAVCPIGTLAVAGLTVTDATGTLVVVTAAVAMTPSHAA